jgi:hypothetical protein
VQTHSIRQHVRCACAQQHPPPLTKQHTLSVLLRSSDPNVAGFILPCSCSSLCVLTVCAKCADHSTKGSVLLTQLFRESAREANQEYYSTVSNKHLKALKTTFTSFVPDNYQQVELVNIAHDAACKARVPMLHRASACHDDAGVKTAHKWQVVLFACLQQACLAVHTHPLCFHFCCSQLLACHDDSKTFLLQKHNKELASQQRELGSMYFALCCSILRSITGG